MKKLRTFYHYSKFIDEIKKDKVLLATSFSRAYTYDWVLEIFPEQLINKKEILKFKAYQDQAKNLIKVYKKEQDDEENYESAYRDLKLKFKNKLHNDFFNNDGYVLAFSKKFEKGWTNKDVADIFKKIGNKFLKIKIDNKIAKRCYVLEQKYWREDYHGPILKKKYGKNWENLAEAFSNEMFKKKKSKLKNYQKFKKDFVRILFANYYNSIVKLDNYKNNFKVPEFWIGEDIPIKMCKFGKVSFEELKKLYNITKKDILKRKITRADISERKKKKSRSAIVKRLPDS